MPVWIRTLVATGPLDQVAAATPGHLEQLRALAAAGRLRLAGRIGRDEGFLDIFDARDLLEAQATAEASPLVAAGLVAWNLRAWEPLDDLGT